MSCDDYIPTPGPLDGERYMPSSGTEGACFHEAWCCQCERDKELNGTCEAERRAATEDDWCPIVAASYRDEAVEWRILPDGTTKCIAFVPMGTPITPPRCEHTIDMFEEA